MLRGEKREGRGIMRMRIGCLCGDLPCNKVCLSRWCPYNTDGHCQDNDVCEDRTNDEGETEVEE